MKVMLSVLPNDRELIDAFANRILKLEDGKVKDFRGTYEEFIQQEESK